LIEQSAHPAASVRFLGIILIQRRVGRAHALLQDTWFSGGLPLRPTPI